MCIAEMQEASKIWQILVHFLTLLSSQRHMSQLQEDVLFTTEENNFQTFWSWDTFCWDMPNIKDLTCNGPKQHQTAFIGWTEGSLLNI